MPDQPLSTSQNDQESSLKAFVGRQAIFDTKEQIFAYELLFRSGLDNVFSGIDGDEATSSVISNSFFDLGINRITGGKKASINFTRNALVGNYAQLLPREKVVVEILEDVDPDEEVLTAVRALKKAGYLIALDDFNENHVNSALVEWADIIKVDIMETPVERCAELIKRINRKNLIYLAEKVETREEYQIAKKVGFTLFQGYFFCKPTIVSGKRIPDSKLSQIQLMREAHKDDLDIDKIEKILRSEVSMSYKLLRFINSARFGLRHEVKSIHQSLCLLGRNTLRKWLSITALTTLGFDKPPELLVTALVRARFCELLSKLFDLEDRADELFLMGMFSTIDALLDMPMERIVKEIGLASDLQSALLGQSCPLTSILNVAIGYEVGNWDLFEESTKGHHLNEDDVPPLHLEAVKTAEELMLV